jgi:putative transcriptional regulator
MSLNFKALDQAKTLSASYADVESKVNGEAVKKLRNKLSFTQAELACLLHVSKKTIESWEEGTNPVQGASAVLIYLLCDEPTLSRRLLTVYAINGCQIPAELQSFVLCKDLSKKPIPFDDTDPCYKTGSVKIEKFVQEKTANVR